MSPLVRRQARPIATQEEQSAQGLALSRVTTVLWMARWVERSFELDTGWIGHILNSSHGEKVQSFHMIPA